MWGQPPSAVRPAQRGLLLTSTLAFKGDPYCPAFVAAILLASTVIAR